MKEITLTDREKEVIKSLSEGLTVEETGELLRISHFTVRSHIKIIRSKLGVKTIGGAIGEAMRLNLIK